MRVCYYVVSDVAGTKREIHSRHYKMSAAEREAKEKRSGYKYWGNPRQVYIMAGMTNRKFDSLREDTLQKVDINNE